MRINTFIVILLVTSIICNNNNHIKGEEKYIKDVKTTTDCIETFTPFVEEYKEITEITPITTKVYVNLRRFVQVDLITSETPKYTYYSFPPPTKVKDAKGQFKLIGTKKADFTMTSGAPTGVKNYEFPWNIPSTATTNDIIFGSTAGGKYEFECILMTSRNANLLAAPDAATLAKYEKIDPFMESFPEIRNKIDDAAIGEGVMLSRVDADGKFNYNIFLSKTQFCHFTCSVDADATKVACDLLVYGTAKYDFLNVNDAYVIGLTGKANYFKAVKADTATDKVVDACVTGSDVECTKPLYTVISKGAEKILTGYYMDDKTKYSVSTSTSPKMPADIQAKFADYKFCFKEPEVQGVSNMFINSILLILIVILMI